MSQLYLHEIKNLRQTISELEDAIADLKIKRQRKEFELLQKIQNLRTENEQLKLALAAERAEIAKVGGV